MLLQVLVSRKKRKIHYCTKRSVDYNQENWLIFFWQNSKKCTSYVQIDFHFLQTCWNRNDIQTGFSWNTGNWLVWKALELYWQLPEYLSYYFKNTENYLLFTFPFELLFWKIAHWYVVIYADHINCSKIMSRIWISQSVLQ